MIDIDKRTFDYAIIEVRFLKSSDVNFAFENKFKLIDIFQEFSCDYLFFKTTQDILPYMFLYSQESNYDFSSVIPWIKKYQIDKNITYNSDLTFKAIVDYVLVFNRSGVHSIKSKIPNLLVEEDLVTTENKWERNVMKEMEHQGYRTPIFISPFEIYIFDEDYFQTKNYKENRKVELF